MDRELIVAVDGPGGVGKSTVSRAVARHFSVEHLDTGAFYRAAALAALRSEAPIDQTDRVIEVVERADIDQEDGRTLLDGTDVSDDIRTDEVTDAVSPVAAIPEVRALMVERQRRWVAERGGSAVVEGRDIGTVVFPDALLKVYLTADPDERARRRAGESGGAASSVRRALERRDTIDSTRAASPLSIAEGAVVIDTTDLDLPDVVARVVAEVDARLG